jgi:hypothetical protein
LDDSEHDDLFASSHDSHIKIIAERKKKKNIQHLALRMRITEKYFLVLRGRITNVFSVLRLTPSIPQRNEPCFGTLRQGGARSSAISGF